MSDLRDELRASLDLHVPAPDAVERAVLAGRKVKRRRAVTASVVAVVLVAGGTTVALNSRGLRPSTLQPGAGSTVRSASDAQRLVDELQAGRFADVREAFSSTLRGQLSELGLSRLWTTVVDDQLGGLTAASFSQHGRVFRGSLSGRGGVGVAELATDSAGRLTTVFVYVQARATDPAVQLANRFASGDFASSPDVTRLLSPTELRSTWQLMLDDGGAVIEVGRPEQQGTQTVVPLTLDHGTAELTVTRTAAGAVTGLTLLKSDPTLEPITRAVVAALVAHRWSAVRDHFNSRMTSGLSESKLAEAWAQVQSQDGAFLNIVSLTTTSAPGATVQIATCRFVRGDVAVQVAYENNGRISGLYLRPA